MSRAFKPFAFRWILADSTGEARSKTSYPSEAAAQRFARPGEAPRKMRVVRRGGPFSDVLEPVEEEEPCTA